MSNALIGFSGFVGSTLLKQGNFESIYRSTTINGIDGQTFDTVVCAGAPAQKWIANQEPEADRQKIEGLIAHLRSIQCKTFILVSTVDVFKSPVDVDEDAPVDESGLHAYGLHRRLLEKFVESHFTNYLIVRLPGLVGPGLRKNVIFDFLNENNVHVIDSRGVFQFYPMVNLWYDIQTSLNAGLRLVHLTAAPISVRRFPSKVLESPLIIPWPPHRLHTICVPVMPAFSVPRGITNTASAKPSRPSGPMHNLSQ
ncbi:pyridine nucleotide transhydrogenase [Azotobacter chroococcum]